MSRPRVSVLILTLNEERMLEQVLESVRWADEIVVLDSGSTDRTEEIARRYTERFHVHPWEGEGAQRRRSLELASAEWILYLDADEIVTPRLRAAIERALADPGDRVGFQVDFLTCFAGRWFGERGWRRERRIRLFRRDRGRFKEATNHSGAVVDGPTGLLPGYILHYSYRGMAHHLEKLNRYSSGVAGDLVRKGKRSSLPMAGLRGLARFLRDYLAGGDFLYGAAGFARSLTIGYYTFLTYAKVWELGRGDAGCGEEVGGGGQSARETPLPRKGGGETGAGTSSSLSPPAGERWRAAPERGVPQGRSPQPRRLS